MYYRNMNINNKAKNETITLLVDWSVDSLNNSRMGIEGVIKKEINGLVADGIYPAGMKLLKVLPNSATTAEIEVSVKSVEDSVKFYTAYCGGDRLHAISELKEFYNLDV